MTFCLTRVSCRAANHGREIRTPCKATTLPAREKKKKACLKQGYKRRLKDVLRRRTIFPRDEGAQEPGHELPLACRQYQRSSCTVVNLNANGTGSQLLGSPIAVSIITRCWTRMPRRSCRLLICLRRFGMALLVRATRVTICFSSIMLTHELPVGRRRSARQNQDNNKAFAGCSALLSRPSPRPPTDWRGALIEVGGQRKRHRRRAEAMLRFDWQKSKSPIAARGSIPIR
ncbi:hypothetical protein GGI35DRAFT_20030 [Trichoderma velutinum]